MEGGINLTEDARVVKFLILEGFDTFPKSGQEVTVDYIGRFPNEGEFDSSMSRNKPLKYIHGVGEVIKGWDIGIASMKRGEKARFIIKSEYGYGKEGTPKVPPNATLEFEIELIHFHNKRKPIPELTDSEKESISNEYKNLGNNYFKRNNLRQASYAYREGIHVIENILERERTEEMKKVWNSLHTNLCIVLSKQEKWNDMIKAALEVLSREKDNPKARYLRGIANKNLKKLDEALDDLEVALKANLTDKKILQEIQEVKKIQSSVLTKEKQVFSKMFNKTSIYEEKINSIGGIPKYDPENLRTFMYIKIGHQASRKIIFELFSKTVPKTAKNFKCLCTGEKNKLCYAGTKIHKVESGFVMQGGDIAKGDGTGSVSIYGDKFDDENFFYKHFGPGVISMANTGENSNGSQFLITFDKTPELDGKNVVFGRVIKGMDVIRDIEKVTIGVNESPVEDIIITDCGLYPTEITSPENCA